MYLDNMSDFDRLEMLFGEDEANKRFESAVGKYVIVEAREDNDTRLFIKSTNDITNARRKDGWWNTFSICKNPCNKGLYIGRISELCHDKVGYPIFIIQIKREISDDFMYHDPFVHVVAMSHLFLNEFDNINDNFNYQVLMELAVKHGYNDGMNAIEIFKTLIEAFIDRKISIEDIDNAANTETQFAADCRRIAEFFTNENNREKYPLLFAKKDKESFAAGLKYENRYAYEDAYLFVSCLIDVADNAVNKGNMTAREENESQESYIERYLQFDKERKAYNKAAKTAAKKAKKAAKNN